MQTGQWLEGTEQGVFLFKLIWQLFQGKISVDLFPDQNICSHKIIKIVYMQTTLLVVSWPMLANSVYCYTLEDEKKGMESKHRDS